MLSAVAQNCDRFPFRLECQRFGAYIFESCSKLGSLTVDSSVRSIGEYAFRGCGKVKSLTVKTKHLSKKKVKACLKGSSVKTIKVKIGSKKTNKKYVKKYKKAFKKKYSGKKVKVKR